MLQPWPLPGEHATHWSSAITLGTECHVQALSPIAASPEMGRKDPQLTREFDHATQTGPLAKLANVTARLSQDPGIGSLGAHHLQAPQAGWHQFTARPFIRKVLEISRPKRSRLCHSWPLPRARVRVAVLNAFGRTSHLVWPERASHFLDSHVGLGCLLFNHEQTSGIGGLQIRASIKVGQS